MLETMLLTLEILQGDKERFPYAPTIVQNTERVVQEVQKILEFRWFQETLEENQVVTITWEGADLDESESVST